MCSSNNYSGSASLPWQESLSSLANAARFTSRSVRVVAELVGQESLQVQGDRKQITHSEIKDFKIENAEASKYSWPLLSNLILLTGKRLNLNFAYAAMLLGWLVAGPSGFNAAAVFDTGRAVCGHRDRQPGCNHPEG